MNISEFFENYTVFEYLRDVKKETYPFLNEVDALIIAMSSYFEYETYFNQQPKEEIILKNLKVDLVKRSTTNKLKQKHYDLMKAIIQNERFNEIVVVDFENESDETSEKQFAAVTYRLSNGEYFIAYRGTDATFVGWKEDLNISFEKHIPSQLAAVKYLDKIIDKYGKDIKGLYIGGHSKGGNLAVYSASFSEKKDQTQIKRIYNFDGPGFHTEILNSIDYLNILPLAIKYIPKSSFVGKLMYTKEKEIIVESYLVSFMQHEAYAWLVRDGAFVQREELTFSAKHIDESQHKWLEDIPNDRRKYIIDEVFDIFKELDIDSYKDITKFLNPTNIKAAIDVYNSTDEEFRTDLKQASQSLIKQLMAVNKKE